MQTQTLTATKARMNDLIQNMFEVEKLSSCKITGITEVVICYDLGHGTKTDKKTFLSPESANGFIYRSKMEWIQFVFEKWAYHKFYLSNSSVYYQKPERLKSLEIATDANKYFNSGISLYTICQYILKIKDHLFNILPISSNPSYDNQRRILQQMIQFSNNNKNS